MTNSLRNRRVYFPVSSPLQSWISLPWCLKGLWHAFAHARRLDFWVWRSFFKIGFWWRNPLPSALRSPRKLLYQHSRVIWSILEVLNVYFVSLCKHCRENSKSLRRMLGYIVACVQTSPFPRATKEIGDVCTQGRYIVAQSASLYALLFVIISVYSIYFCVGHFNCIQGYILYR